MIFKRLGNKWNNSVRSNLPSNHLHSLPGIQATCSLFSFQSQKRKKSEDREEDRLVWAGSRIGLSRPVSSSGLSSPLWECRGGRGWFHRSLQACQVSDTILEISTSMAEKGWDQWKAIILRWVIPTVREAGRTSTSALSTVLSEGCVELNNSGSTSGLATKGALASSSSAEKTEQDHVCKGLRPGARMKNSSINSHTVLPEVFFSYRTFLLN